MPTPWQEYRARWRSGCGSELCGRAHNVVLVRGSLPCDVLLIGEGPGESEDALGRPFVGPAGNCFQKYVIDRAVPPGVRYALGNLLGCIPTDDCGNKLPWKELDDPDALVAACAPRLVGLVALARPKLIVCVGEQADTYLGPKSAGMRHGVKLPPDLAAVPRVHVMHPAAILRMNETLRGIQWQRCEVVLRNAVEDYVLHPGQEGEQCSF